MATDTTYALRFDGAEVERTTNVVDLYWKARRAVCLGEAKTAEVQTVEGRSYAHAFFTKDSLRPWERVQP